MTTLHLGCGLDYQPGAINVDRYDLNAADLQADALRLPLGGGSVDRIEARQLVEHLGYAGTIYALAEWQRVLSDGGTLLIETPDRPAACRAAAEPEPPAAALHWLFGLPWPSYAHRTLFDAGELGDLCRRAGFADIEISHRPRPQPTLSLAARKASDPLAALRGRLRAGFTAAGIVDPLTAPPHLARLEEIIDGIVAAVQALPQDGPQACLATILGTTARYDPQLARVAVQVLVALEMITPAVAGPFLDLTGSLAAESFPARLAAALRREPAPPGTQAIRLRRLSERTSLYLTARLHPGEAALQPLRREFDAATADLIPADREIGFFCAETCAALSQRETARGARACARDDLESAQQHLSAAAAYDVDNPLPLWNLARLALAQDRRLEALEWYAALLELLPEAGRALGAEMDAATGREPKAMGRFGGPLGQGLGA